jgi:hypothetical protein
VGNEKKNNWNDKRCRLAKVEKDIQGTATAKKKKREMRGNEMGG